jgi:hypothetical protein
LYEPDATSGSYRTIPSSFDRRIIDESLRHTETYDVRNDHGKQQEQRQVASVFNPKGPSNYDTT